MASVSNKTGTRNNASKSSYLGLTDRSLVQNYSATTVIYIVGFLAMAIALIYLYNFYKTFKGTTGTTVPNSYPDCPDYWESIGNGVCRNTNFIGSCAKTPGSNTVDFSGDIFTNVNTGAYAKCKWSQACNMAWSGVERIC